MIDLSPPELETIQGILRQQVPACEVRAFGSRVTWTAKDYSDLDLAVMGEGALPVTQLGRLREAFAESNLRFRVDVLDWHTTSPEFRQVIEQGYEVIQKPNGSWSMRVEWHPKQFGDCAELVRETVLPAATAGMPYIGLEHIAENRLSLTGVGVAEDVTSMKSRFRAGDILFGKLRPYFRKVVRVPFEGVCSTDIWVVRPKIGMDAGYIFYWMATQEFVDASMRGSEGTKMPRAKWDFVARLSQPIPPLPTQRAIAHVLGTLDDKIELNRRMNETLEAMARALFKEWFVDGADVEWEEKPLDEIARYLNGLALQKFPAHDGEDFLPVIKIAQLRKNDSEGADRASTEIGPDYIVNDGDVLFSWSGSLEVVLWSGGKGALNQHLFKVTSETYPKWFYYLWTKHHLPDFQEIAAGKATTMGHIQRHHLHAATVLLPPPNKLAQMTEQMAPLIDLHIRTAVQSRTLAALRDALLPKLLSGELMVET
jgi:type I restriction enzyme S subunit